MHWTIGQFPELDHLDPAQRAAVLRGVPWWTYPLMALRALVVGGVAAGVVAAVLIETAGAAVAASTFIVLGVGLTLGAYLTQLNTIRRTLRSEIAASFAGRRPPFCLHCGYDLRVTSADRCPECGRPVVVPPVVGPSS